MTSPGTTSIVLVIHEVGVHLERGYKLLVNIDHEHPISIFCASIESLRCCPVMQSLFLRFIRASMCLDPCVP